MTSIPRLLLPVVVFCLAAPGAYAGPAAKDAGESKEAQHLKHRAKAPKTADIDPAAGLDALLTKSGPDDWSADKAATLIGVVAQIEREEDGDTHIALAPQGKETDTTQWVVCEVTPEWRKKAPSLAASRLGKLRGQQVKITGWLFYEPDAGQADPRGTRWELHPVTSIGPVEEAAKVK